MLHEYLVINDCYVLRSRIGEDSYTEHWIATAHFSAIHFLLRFVKQNVCVESCIDKLRTEALRSYHVRGAVILDFIEIEIFENRVFVASEYHEERALLQVLESGKRWDYTTVCNAIITLAQGIHAFHELGILYGNLNAENVAVHRDGQNALILKIRKPVCLPCCRLCR